MLKYSEDENIKNKDQGKDLKKKGSLSPSIEKIQSKIEKNLEANKEEILPNHNKSNDKDVNKDNPNTKEDISSSNKNKPTVSDAGKINKDSRKSMIKIIEEHLKDSEIEIKHKSSNFIVSNNKLNDSSFDEINKHLTNLEKIDISI